MKEWLQQFGFLWLRVLMGFGMASHGWQKIFGGRMEKFAAGVAEMDFPLPGLFAWSAALSELVGGLLIALGIGTRLAALFVFATMGVAAFLRHAADPFFKKELALAYWAMAGFFFLAGAGRFSVGRLLYVFFQKGPAKRGLLKKHRD